MDSVTTLMHRVYDIVSAPEMLPEVLDEVCHLVDANAASIAALEMDAAQVSSVWTSALITDLLLRPQARAGIAAETPLYAYLTRSNESECFNSDEALLRSYGKCANTQPRLVAEFRAFLRDQYGIHHRLMSPVGRAGIQAGVIQLHFEDGPKKRREHARQLGGQLLPHFSRAMTVGQPLAALHARFRSVLDVLDKLSLAVVITGLDGRVWLTNQAARELIERRDALCISDTGMLRGGNPGACEALTTCFGRIAALGCNGDALSFPVSLARGDKGQKGRRDHYIGDCSLMRHADLGAVPGVLLVLSDPLAKTQANRALLKQMFGLTNSEAVVCDMLVRGYSNADIADARNVSLDTVASQVKSVFRKTNCNKRGQLVFLVNSVTLPVRQTGLG